MFRVAELGSILTPGPASYSFVWAMAGENQSFDDMDGLAIADMR